MKMQMKHSSRFRKWLKLNKKKKPEIVFDTIPGFFWKLVKALRISEKWVILIADDKFKGENCMKATGITRKIDELGRIVIPKEIWRTLRIREGTPLEIITEKNGEII